MNSKILNPPARIGIIGGGQLGKMISHSAKQMGYNVTTLDPTSNSPAMQVSDMNIIASFSDRDALKDLANECDVITYEFEHINSELLIELENQGHRIIPSGKTLKSIQDKYQQKMMLKLANLPVPKFYKVTNEDEILEAVDKLGLPIVLKNARGGYDGKGNFIIKDRQEVSEAIRVVGSQNLMVEEFVSFSKELSIVVARNDEGLSFYPIVENVHEDSILRVTKAPALIDKFIEEQIFSISKKVVEVLNDMGVFCIEFFLSDNGEVYINEIAPRPHNSAHYSIEGCITSQFEQLVRIISGLPLGSTKLIKPSVMVNILGNEEVVGDYTIEGLDDLLKDEEVHFHLYGKKATDYLKKIGHITVCSETIKDAEEKALGALNKINISHRKERESYGKKDRNYYGE